MKIGENSLDNNVILTNIQRSEIFLVFKENEIDCVNNLRDQINKTYVMNGIHPRKLTLIISKQSIYRLLYSEYVSNSIKYYSRIDSLIGKDIENIIKEHFHLKDVVII